MRCQPALFLNGLADRKKTWKKESDTMIKQVIIARKDLNMSPGKLAAQVSHASMAFLTSSIKDSAMPAWKADPGISHKDERGENSILLSEEQERAYYSCTVSIEKEVFEQWFSGAFTKVVLQARNRSQLTKAKSLAEELGMQEGLDFFLIRDHCRTELEPEETGPDGIGQTLTCIGFRPMDSDVIDSIGKKYHMYV